MSDIEVFCLSKLLIDKIKKQYQVADDDIFAIWGLSRIIKRLLEDIIEEEKQK